MEFKEILNRKIEHYGKTEAAYEFAAEEYSNKLIKKAQTEQLILHDVSQQRELLDWLSNEPDHNIRKSDIDEILHDFKYYQSNCG